MKHSKYFEHVNKARMLVKTIKPYLTKDELNGLVKTLTKGSVSMLINKEK